MSFDINWDNLVSDNIINQGIKEFLDDSFQNVTLPSFISGLSVTEFNLGTIPPDITIRHVSSPFNEFYDESLQDIDERLRNLSNKYINQRNSYMEESSDEDDNASTTASTFSEGLLNSHKPKGVKDFEGQLGEFKTQYSNITKIENEASKSRNSSDSLSLMLGHNSFDFLHNHNLNGLGIGTIATPNTHMSTRADTPTNILNHGQFMNGPREKSTSFIRSKEVSTDKDPNDIQLLVEFNYHGDLEIVVMVNLLVNYPSPNFISLPIKLHITDLVIHSIAVIAYLKQAVYVSFLCDINEQSSDYFGSSSLNHHFGASEVNSGGNFVDYVNNGNTQERIDIIKKVKIESEIGGVEHNVLRNVGKVEKFLIDQLRGLLRDEIAWPNWICLDIAEHESDEEDNE